MADEDATSSSHPSKKRKTSPSSSFIHDVFLSFRGDTRHAFTDHLYHALTNRGIDTFRDEPNLRLGDEIGPSLLEAIEKSRISIVVLCQNYASSSWCLDELVKIMECRDKGRASVFPIFYRVDPADVRHQRNQYGAAMIKHESRYAKDPEKLKVWRLALSAVCKLSGKHCTKGVYESEIIKKLVEEVYYIKEVEFENNKERRHMEEEDVVGFVDSFGKVVDQLKEEDACSNVVSIIGMGGLGKTTLARKIYNSNKVMELFPYRAWSSVSKDYKAGEVFLSLLHCLPYPKSELKNLSEKDMKEKVREYLMRTKYLVVLDDVWEPEVWDDVKGAFPNEKNGSRILITSRNNEVANYTSPRPPYDIRLLNKQESWELFCKKVFWGRECPSNLVPIGTQIVDSCGGLPIAIVSLAGILAKKRRSEREWLRIKGYVKWHLAHDDTKVMDVLKLSYDNLPEKLQQCFLYFGIYPEDYNINVRKLIQQWIAEGFIQPRECGMSNAPEPEDIGETYLDYLVDRNLVQVVSRRLDGGVKLCQIHDFFREICISLCKANDFLEVCRDSITHSAHTASNPHRLSLSMAHSYWSSVRCNQSCTRSLFFFNGQGYASDKLKYFQSVHVLHVAKNASITLVPSDLKMMVHLRYLRIRFPRPDYHLDFVDCIWNLTNLETLHLRGLGICIIGSGFWKLERLRHLYIYIGLYAKLPADKPTANSKMWKLQTLFEVFVDKYLAFLLDNGSFPELRKLGLICHPEDQGCPLDELLQSVRHLSNLRTLRISCNFINATLKGVVFPVNLTKISLFEFAGMNWKILARLPKLHILKLCSGVDFNLNCAKGEFPQLQVLILGDLSVKRWRLEEGAMPRLRQLLALRCMGSEFPQQLWSLTTLREVHVTGPPRIPGPSGRRFPRPGGLGPAVRNSLQNVKVNDDCKITIDGMVIA